MNTFETPIEPAIPAGSMGRSEVGPAGAGSGPTSQSGAGLAADNLGEGVGSAPRTWTVVLPPLELLNANHRLHWTKVVKVVSEIRTAAGWAARAAKVPHLARAHIECELRFWDTRRRDPSNWASPSAKAAIDGIVDAGVLDDDDDKHLDGPDMRLGRIDPSLAYVTSVTGKRVRQARMVLHITELPEVTHA